MRMVGRIGRSGFNLVISSAGEIVARLLGLVYLVVLARYLQPTGFGQINALLAYFALAMVIGSFGLDRLALRELARGDDRDGHVFTTLLSLRVAAAALAGVLLIAIGSVVAASPPWHLIILAIALIPSGVASAYTSGFQARERFGPTASAAVVAAAVLLCSALLGAALEQSLSFFLWGIAAAETGRAAWLVGVARRGGWGRRMFRLEWTIARRAIEESVPYWVLAILGMIYFRVDLIMLDALVGGEAVGFYAGAFRILEVLALAPTLVMGVLFPRFARLRSTDPEAARRLYLAVLGLLVWGGVVLSLLGAAASRPLLTLLFTSEYVAATVPLLWLMGALLFLFWHAPNATVLMAGDRLGPVVAWSLVTAGFNVAANVVLIPWHGAAGAAAATTASELLSLVIFTPIVCRRLGIPFRRYVRAVIWPSLRREDLNLLLGRRSRAGME